MRNKILNSRNIWLQLLTIVEQMINNSQNNSGFFKTPTVSNESLISGISNFDFGREEIELRTDAQLEIPERLMLGKRAERYFSEWLKQSSEYELVAENIQIIDNKQTLGEFDFIVRRIKDDQLIHIELVYKFYLFDPSVEGKEIEKWIGPNRGDRLDYKLDKLANHQFPLLYSLPSKKRLSEFRIVSSKIEQQVLFMANLFIPTDHKVGFSLVNEEAIEGTWMRLNEWEAFYDTTTQFAIPDKKDWFSRELVSENWLSKEEAIEQIISLHSQSRSPLVWAKFPDESQQRDFVVYW